MCKRFNIIIGITFFFLTSVNLKAQESNLSVDQRFKEIIEESETFKQYKVIPKVTLNEFLNILNDSLQSSQTKINKLANEVTALETKEEGLNNEIEKLSSNLKESELKNDTIAFLGIPVQKSIYHLIVWILILSFVVLSGIAYLMFKRSNRLTLEAKKEAQQVNDEFEEYRTNAKQKEIKLKRELQTAHNTLTEKGIKI